MIEVTPEDEAAASAYLKARYTAVFRGDCDHLHDTLKQAFARHRQAALIEGYLAGIEAAAAKAGSFGDAFIAAQIRALDPEAVVKATPPA